RITRRLERETKTVRCLLAPVCVGRRFLRGVIGTVDLDRCQLAAGELEFTLLRQAGRIEIVAPGRVVPSADADAQVRGDGGSLWCGFLAGHVGRWLSWQLTHLATGAVSRRRLLSVPRSAH